MQGKRRGLTPHRRAAAVDAALVHPGGRAVRVADAPPIGGLGDDLHRQTLGVIDPEQAMVVAGTGPRVHRIELQRHIAGDWQTRRGDAFGLVGLAAATDQQHQRQGAQNHGGGCSTSAICIAAHTSFRTRPA